ncbi:ATP-binding protein [Streptomyces jumonjinensis]|uniref:ATP-binding protein n=1 Tax=Streptomyces jumonjinensis TaxID=1945 RepID=UPI00389A677F
MPEGALDTPAELSADHPGNRAAGLPAEFSAELSAERSANRAADRLPSMTPGAAAEPEPLHRRLGCTDLKSVSEVRRVLRELLGQWDGPDTADVAQLLASELVTNALVHTGHGAVVTATVASATLRVEVRDFMAGLPLPDPAHRRRDPLDVNGRGLALVQSLADSWGVRTQSAGKVVWFELRERPV